MWQYCTIMVILKWDRFNTVSSVSPSKNVENEKNNSTPVKLESKNQAKKVIVEREKVFSEL